MNSRSFKSEKEIVTAATGASEQTSVPFDFFDSPLKDLQNVLRPRLSSSRGSFRLEASPEVKDLKKATRSTMFEPKWAANPI